MCARAIQDYVDGSRTKIELIDLSLWSKIRHEKIDNLQVAAYTPVKRILSNLIRNDDLTNRVKSEYFKLLMTGESTFVRQVEEVTTFLCRDGLLDVVSIEKNLFSLGPPIIQDCVMLGLAELRPVPSKVFPILNGQIDVLGVLKVVLQYLDKSYLTSAYSYATKKSEIKGITGRDNVLREAVYSLEVVTVLRSWLPAKYQIFPEVNSRTRSADVFIKNNLDDTSIIFELISNERYTGQKRGKERKGTFVEHISRASEYATTLNSIAWVFHFIGVDKFPKESEVLFPAEPSCSCAYIYHLHDFTQMKIYAKAKDKSKHEFELDFTENQQTTTTTILTTS